MAKNTKENREELANQMVEELYYPDVKRYVVQLLAKAWDADDDEWNHAADELMGQIYGEPFGGE
tara:strand:- start:39 stop:230 length:192 start_codon:yes stop_codon:yes gene_type:complete